MAEQQPAGRVALTIAGSDPSGGAGIQADLKTFTAIGVYGAAAITCLTAQNSLGVSAVSPVPPRFVHQQVRLVLEDLPVTHIKTGMIGTGAIAEALGELLARFRGEIICDPVMRASDGKSLFVAGDLDLYRVHILGRATIITPNIPELALLAGRPCRNRAEALDAAGRLFQDYPRLRALVITGGHLEESAPEATDFLLLRGEGGSARLSRTSSHCRIATTNTHGTGCTFAAALTAFHLLTSDDEQAFNLAGDFTAELIRKSATLALGRGRGPLAHHLHQR